METCASIVLAGVFKYDHQKKTPFQYENRFHSFLPVQVSFFSKVGTVYHPKRLAIGIASIQVGCELQVEFLPELMLPAPGEMYQEVLILRWCGSNAMTGGI